MKTSLRRQVGRGSWAAALATAMLLSGALVAPAATDQRDQFQSLVFGQQFSLPQFAQTFTAGMDGQLDKVTLGSTATSSTAITVSIQTLNSSGQPSGTTVGTAVTVTGPWTCCATFKDVTFSPISIHTGDQLAIVVEPLGGRFVWKNANTIDSYAGGHAWVGDPWVRGSTISSEDFAFETWVVPATVSPNQAPTLDVVTNPVVVNEGTPPNNTGSFSDPDGDAVTLSASSGTVSKTGTGTWSWTQPASDEGADQTVSIFAADGHGHTVTKTFTLHTNAVAPVASIVLDPPLIPEGTPEAFTGAATTAFPGDAAGLTYRWVVTKGGSTATFAGGSGTTFTFTPDDDGPFVVSFTASDDGGMGSRPDSVTVYGQNVAPKATITGVAMPSPLLPQESVTFTGTFSDPGLVDTHTVTWFFGDGTSYRKDFGPGGSATFSISHTYTEAKVYTVRLQVVDDDNGLDQATTTVTVMTTQQAVQLIAGKVNQLTGLNAGNKNSLIAKLNAASAAAARGDNRAASNQLNAFLNELDADVKTGKISSADAALLRAAVTSVKASLGTYNRFLEWLPLVF